MTRDGAPRDLIEAYLGELHRGLRVLPGEAEAILPKPRIISGRRWRRVSPSG